MIQLGQDASELKTKSIISNKYQIVATGFYVKVK